MCLKTFLIRRARNLQEIISNSLIFYWFRWNFYQRSYIQWDMRCEDEGLDRKTMHAEMSNADTVSFLT